MKGIHSCIWDIGIHLIEPLKRLSSADDEQVRWLREKKIAVDELGLDFDDGYRTLRNNGEYQEAYDITSDQMRSLDAIDAALDAISGEENSEFWTFEALKEKPEWQQIRKLARKALILLNNN